MSGSNENFKRAGEVTDEFSGPGIGERAINVPDDILSTEDSEPTDVEPVTAGGLKESAKTSDQSTGNTDSDETTTDSKLVDYDQLVEEAAYYISEGLMDISEVGGVNDLDVGLSEFRNDVREFIEKNDIYPQGAGNDETFQTIEPVEIDWQALYDKYDSIRRGEPLSRTQWEGILTVSDQVPGDKAVADEVIKKAVCDEVMVVAGENNFAINWGEL